MANKHKKAKLSPLSLRITEAERSALEHAANGQSLSAYIRSRLFGDKVSPRRKRTAHKPVPVKDHQILSRALSALGQSRLSSNLNQLAKAIHMGALPVSPKTEEDLQKACAQVRQMKKLLIEALGLKPEGK